MLYVEYNAMIETGNECQLSGCLLFQPSFSLCRYNCHLRNMRHTTRWLWYGLGEKSTLRITGPDTARTKRALVRLIDTSSLDSRLCQARRQVHTTHAWIVPSCVVSAGTFNVVLGLTLRMWRSTVAPY